MLSEQMCLEEVPEGGQRLIQSSIVESSGLRMLSEHVCLEEVPEGGLGLSSPDIHFSLCLQNGNKETFRTFCACLFLVVLFGFQADPVMVLNDDNIVVVTSKRLVEGGVPQLEQGMIVGQLTLADALIIGNCSNQVKFSELTIDMFRMLQALEREPVNLATQMNKPGMLEPSEKPAKRENPHKYLLYKPTFSQLYTFLSAAFKELPANSVLLMYLSATGVFPTGRSDYEGETIKAGKGIYDLKDQMAQVLEYLARQQAQPPAPPLTPAPELTPLPVVIRDSLSALGLSDAVESTLQNARASSTSLHPGDLYPFTRKPLFVVVDSSNSVAYKNFTNLFGQPVVCLLSPTVYPKNMQDQSQRGSLFTLFLYNPLMAFLYVCGLSSMRSGLWDKCQEFLRKVNRDLGQLISRSRSIGKYQSSETPETRNYPETYPQLPKEETVENPMVQKHVLELASILDVQNLFCDNTLDDY
ncbi:UNVERIFIED_CONTAM: hypothetical protein FKN15_073607 [Acipenser sinensis]